MVPAFCEPCRHGKQGHTYNSIFIHQMGVYNSACAIIYQHTDRLLITLLLVTNYVTWLLVFGAGVRYLSTVKGFTFKYCSNYNEPNEELECTTYQTNSLKQSPSREAGSQ
jgi:hypothetical protein